MADPVAQLAALQHGDSFFPSGATALSGGLETLCGEGRVSSAADLAEFVAGQLLGQWASCTRPAMVAAHRAGDDLGRVAAIDRLLDAQTLAREMREGSRRMGGALLAVHDGLGTPGASDYRRRVRAGAAPGHGAVVQGLLWRGAGIPEDAAGAMSAHGLCVGLLGAALRLGVIGHRDGQRILTELRPLMAGLLAEPPPPVERMTAYVPEAEIAIQRHETAESRLFAN